MALSLGKWFVAISAKALSVRPARSFRSVDPGSAPPGAHDAFSLKICLILTTEHFIFFATAPNSSPPFTISLTLAASIRRGRPGPAWGVCIRPRCLAASDRIIFNKGWVRGRELRTC